MSELKSKHKIPIEELSYRLEKEKTKGLKLSEIDPCCGIIGQERALKAVEIGLEIKSKGYNIFVTGSPGTGRTTAVKLLLEDVVEAELDGLKDLAFVNNFSNPESPRALYFKAGDGRKFRKSIGYLIESLLTIIPKIFSGEDYRERRGRIIKEFETRQKEMFQEFEKKLKDKGFVLVQLQMGPAIRPDLQPVINDQPVAMEDLEKSVEEGKYPADEFERVKQEYEALFDEMQVASRQSRKVSGDLEEELNRLDTSMVAPLISDKIETLKNLYKDKKTNEYLDEVHEEILRGLDIFRPSGPDEEGSGRKGRGDFFSQFSVNLLVDNAGRDTRPIIVEEFPTYKNLFGSIEQIFAPTTGWHTDFTRIHGGSMMQANGGFLVINATDLFLEPTVWPTLKRALRSGKIAISNLDVLQMRGSGLKPEPIELDVKVVLIGEGRVYDILYNADEEFKKVFKIKAEFDNVMVNDKEGIAQYAQFARKIADEDKLIELDETGFAAIAEHGVKLSGRKDRLSTRFTLIADLIREASWQAAKDGKKHIDRDTVIHAVEMQRNRVNLVESKVHEMFERDIYLIDVAGYKVGQINGLSVYNLGDYSFGRPSRITATISPGGDGVINIEREAAMSGRIHDKGVLILSGFMRERFGGKHPLVFTASLCFEQSYGGIDGDSASSTEVYALLSALSGKPINQGLAVTGSVNQKGEIQPIGGVNEKIEGYFEVCKINGLTGEQGVLIPIQNRQDLMLRDEVIEAVHQGKFHIYAITHIDEGIEVLTGVEAGKASKDGTFPEGSINYLAALRLRELAMIWREYIGHKL